MKLVKSNHAKRGAAGLGMLWALLFVIATSAGSLGCEDCAVEGEYCVELDCCDDLVCSYDETAGYRCR